MMAAEANMINSKIGFRELVEEIAPAAKRRESPGS